MVSHLVAFAADIQILPCIGGMPAPPGGHCQRTAPVRSIRRDWAGGFDAGSAMGGSMSKDVKGDAAEAQEWLDALDSVEAFEGLERVDALLEAVVTSARRK